MSGWQLTAGLTNLRNQVNARWPNRDKASDGTIGDAAHAAESSSGHNPDDTAGSHAEWNGDPDSVPEVRAWDMDSDLGEKGSTAQMVVDHFRALPGFDTVNRYMIYNRRIYRASNGYASEPYSGASAHTEHIHFSGAWSQASDNNTTFDYRLDEVGDMAVQLNADDLTAIAKAVINTDGIIAAPPGTKNADGTPNEFLSLNTFVKTINANVAALLARPAADVDEEALAVALAPLIGIDKAAIQDALRSIRVTTAE